ncbi:hypothetical protein [Saccharothrix stipae]
MTPIHDRGRAFDPVFRDGHDEQPAHVTGDVDAGYTASLTVRV